MNYHLQPEPAYHTNNDNHQWKIQPLTYTVPKPSLRRSTSFYHPTKKNCSTYFTWTISRIRLLLVTLS